MNILRIVFMIDTFCEVVYITIHVHQYYLSYNSQLLYKPTLLKINLKEKIQGSIPQIRTLKITGDNF